VSLASRALQRMAASGSILSMARADTGESAGTSPRYMRYNEEGDRHALLTAAGLGWLLGSGGTCWWFDHRRSTRKGEGREAYSADPARADSR